MGFMAVAAGIAAFVFMLRSVRAQGLINRLQQQLDQRQQDLQSAQQRLALLKQQLQQAKAAAERVFAEARECAVVLAGDACTLPSCSQLDELAEAFGYSPCGQKLKEARECSRQMLRTGQAAICDDADPHRRERVVRLVVDAFNGRVEGALLRSGAGNPDPLAQEIHDAAARVNLNGAAFGNARISQHYLQARLDELHWATRVKRLEEQARDEQRQLHEQIGEEQKARRDYERAIQEALNEQASLRRALQQAREQVLAASAAQRAEFEARLAQLEAQLQCAEDKNQRARSMAQQTRAGHVYVISNVGSFGEQVFKIGMTRRLEPLDRVRELGDASVPFEYDVHAMIFSNDAPGLEKRLHRHFLREQVNKVNPRKEFFRIALPAIRRAFEELGVQAQWTMSAKAREYRETQRIEQQISANPALAAAWTRPALELEASLELEVQQALA
ncbi:DUF4041 domain-containing protein [Pseudomonas sp. NFXW11]